MNVVTELCPPGELIDGAGQIGHSAIHHVNNCPESAASSGAVTPFTIALIVTDTPTVA